MSKKERKMFRKLMRRRYAAMATKKAKGQVLDHYCEITGNERKGVIKTLNSRTPAAKNKGRPALYTKEDKIVLQKLWMASDMMCGKLLKSVVGLYLDSLMRREVVADDVRRRILAMSASTIDRMLRDAKVRAGGRKNRRRASLDEHRRQIPLKVDVWPEQYPKQPGWVQVDTVAHCGGHMDGSFVWTLTMTDVATAWTTLRSIWNKGAVDVCAGISYFIGEAPFTVWMINSDNGGEFVNHHVARFFSELAPKVKRSRSRSYRKNDNAHVEQKNGAQVRPLFGHGRIADPGLIALMNKINFIQGLLKNLFTPTMRLLSKERVGSKTIKQFESVPMTPAQRVLASPEISDEQKEYVRSLIRQHDIFGLRDDINTDLRSLARKLAAAAAPAGATPEARPEQPSAVPGPRASSVTARKRQARSSNKCKAAR